MKAIVYTSNTGFTRRYAEMLSEKTGIDVFSLKQARKAVEDGAEIIYMGWISAGRIKGFKAAAKRYEVRAVCAVGAMPPETQREYVKNASGVGELPLFLLRGGFDINKLHGIYRLTMQIMVRAVKKKAEQDADFAVKQGFDLLIDGGSRVDVAQLAPVIEFIRQNP